jgi:3-methyladenine DNA glycosylase AlkD
MTATANEVRKTLMAVAHEDKADHFKRFCKTGTGQYAETDQFWGVIVPDQRKIAKQFRDLPRSEIDLLLTDPIHECRLTAIFIMVDQFTRSLKSKKTTPPDDARSWVDYLLSRTAHINNWDLVDSCAYQILGTYLLTIRDRVILNQLASSANLWEQRLAVIATRALIKEGEFQPTLTLAKKLLRHPHDLIHKAVGWMLREVGEQDQASLKNFLDQHAHQMPRTMLRYAIEKLPDKQRRAYLEQSG